MKPSPGFFTLSEVAKLLRIRRADVYTFAGDGRIRTVDVAGRRRVTSAELERIQAEGIPKRIPIAQPTRPKRFEETAEELVRRLKRIPV